MDFEWEHALSMSLRQDLQQIRILTKEMCELVRDHRQINSWLYPQSSFLDVDENNGGNYTQRLEAVLDGVYIILNMFVVYVNQSAPVQSGKMPARLTLGQSLEVLWIKVKTFVADTKRPVKVAKKTNAEITLSDKSSQTTKGINAKGECDSCYVSTTCIKRIADALDEYSCSKTKATRESVRSQVFDTTTFGAMMKMTVSIESDIEALIEHDKDISCKMDLISQKNDALVTKLIDRIDKEKYDRLEIELNNERKKTCSLEKEVFKTKLVNEKITASIAFLYPKYEEIVSKINGFDGKMSDMMGIIMDKIEQKNKKVSNILRLIGEYNQKGVMQRVNSLEERNRLLKIKFCEVVNSLKPIAKSAENQIYAFDQFRLTVDEKLKRKCEDIERVQELAKKCDAKGLKLKCEQLQLSEKMEHEKRCQLEIKYCNVVQESKKFKQLELFNLNILFNCVLVKIHEHESKIMSDLECKMKSIIKLENLVDSYKKLSTGVVITGNPIQDMTHQMEANENKMAVLQQENRKLHKTINRLKLLKLA